MQELVARAFGDKWYIPRYKDIVPLDAEFVKIFLKGICEMKKDIIETLFYKLFDTEFYDEGEQCNECEEFNRIISTLDEKTYFRLDELVSQMEVHYEKAGFRQGFKLGMRLALLALDGAVNRKEKT